MHNVRHYVDTNIVLIDQFTVLPNFFLRLHCMLRLFLPCIKLLLYQYEFWVVQGQELGRSVRLERFDRET